MAALGHGYACDGHGLQRRRRPEEMTVAIVDDNRRVVDLYAELLAALGHATYSFVDGETFLDALPALFPDLVILDRRMPRLDGLEVARRTRALRPELPILMISASAAGAAGSAAVIDRFLAKPCTIEQFADAVTELLALQRRTAGVSPSGADG